jgi:hypothetical protein
MLFNPIDCPKHETPVGKARANLFATSNRRSRRSIVVIFPRLAEALSTASECIFAKQSNAKRIPSDKVK